MRDLYDIINPPSDRRRHDFDDFTDPPEDTLDGIDISEDGESMDSLDEIIDSILNPPEAP